MIYTMAHVGKDPKFQSWAQDAGLKMPGTFSNKRVVCACTEVPDLKS